MHVFGIGAPQTGANTSHATGRGAAVTCGYAAHPAGRKLGTGYANSPRTSGSPICEHADSARTRHAEHQYAGGRFAPQSYGK